VDTWEKDHSAFWVKEMEAKWEGKGSVSEIRWDDVLAEYDVRGQYLIIECRHGEQELTYHVRPCPIFLP
jgi:hypothetical protein